ncbi:hypothetical protein TNCV_652551 [Trichonephila clavipes]|nr:hypothetical protein TNCV_652551 [Trichonephila clavipes]
MLGRKHQREADGWKSLRSVLGSIVHKITGGSRHALSLPEFAIPPQSSMERLKNTKLAYVDFIYGLEEGNA